MRLFIHFKVFLLMITFSNSLQGFSQNYQFEKEIRASDNPALHGFSSAVSVATDVYSNFYVLTQNKVIKYGPDNNVINYFGNAGTNEYEFNNESSIALDQSGNIYLLSKQNSTIKKFSPSGTFIKKWGSVGTGNGQMKQPHDLAIDSQGKIYIADYENNRIVIFNTEGSFLGNVTNGGGVSINHPTSIALDQQGNFYIPNPDLGRVRKFSSSWALLTSWEGYANYKYYVTVDHSNNVYVYNHTTIKKLNSSGVLQVTWNTQKIQKLAPTPDGYAYVANGTNVLKFNLNGVLQNTLGSIPGNGGFTNPIGIALSNDDLYYIRDTYLTQKFNQEGTFLSNLNSMGRNGYIAIDNSGNFFITDNISSQVKKHTPSGHFITSWGSVGSGNGQFVNPTGICLDAEGNVYVADELDRIQKFSNTGEFLLQWGNWGAEIGHFNNPAGLTIDPSGNIYVSDKDNHRIQKFSSTGTYITSWGGYGNAAGLFNTPAGICSDNHGNIFVVDQGNNRIQKFTSDGVFITMWGESGNSQGKFNSPTGIAVGPSGKVWIADSGNNRVQIFSVPFEIICSINSPAPFCQGSTITINFNVSTAFNNDNVFTAQISDATGSFANPTNIGETNGSTSGSISATFPYTIPSGSNYRVRVIGSSPSVIGSDNGTSFSIGAAPSTPIISGASDVCPNKTYLYKTASNILYSNIWSIPPGASIVQSNSNYSQIVVQFGTTGGEVTLRKKLGSCISQKATINIEMKPDVNSNLIISGPTIICPNESNLTYKVINQAQDATYNWKVPSDAIIISGQGTPEINVKWGSQSDAVTVYETTSCGNGALNTYEVTTTTSYEIQSTTAGCGSTVSIPINAISEIRPNLIGLDFAINYDPNVLTPNGKAQTGPVATSYGTCMLNTNTPGKLYVSIYLNNAPTGTFFSQSPGEIIKVDFIVNPGVPIGTTSELSTDPIEESDLISSTIGCGARSGQIVVSGVTGGKIVYQNTDRPLSYSYELQPTYIYGTNDNCVNYNNPILPDINGIFNYSPLNGNKIVLKREVLGDISIPAINCSNVQGVINSQDHILAANIANYKITPKLFELLAADVNLDGKVTAGDASLISSRSVNANNCEFPQAWNYTFDGNNFVPNSAYTPSIDWLFIDETTLNSPEFTSGFGRNNVPSVPNCLSAPSGPSSCNLVVSSTYHAILLGDVNGNWKSSYGASLKKSANSVILFDIENTITTQENTLLIPVYCQNIDFFTGVDFSIDYNSNISIVKVISNLHGNQSGIQWNNIDSKRLMVSAYSSNTNLINYPVLYLEVISNKPISPDDIISSVTYINGETASLSFKKTATTSLTDSSSIQTELYPNPSNSQTYLRVNDSHPFVKLIIRTIEGKVVYVDEETTTRQDVLLPTLDAGIYLIEISSPNGKTIKKLVKN
ncbi:MAG TPA: 6-bladed beta-propeller [Cytophagaceae bacterium]